MKKIIFILLAIVVVVVGVGYGLTKMNTGNQETSKTDSSNTDMDAKKELGNDESARDTEHGVKLAGTRIDLQNANNLKQGNVTLAFKLYGIDAHEFGPDDLKIAHEKRMHLILVRDDVTGFQHLHPEYQNNRWTVTTNVPTQGSYQMYVDIEPVEEKETTLRMPITIGGPTEKAQFPEVSADFSAMVGDVKTVLQADSSFAEKKEIKMTFVLTQNGKSVTKIDPYLGSFGHVVLIRHTEPSHYIHAHPITKINPTDGKVVFETQFPTSGMYTIFAQFNVNGQVKTFPITVKVGMNEQAGSVVSGH